MDPGFLYDKIKVGEDVPVPPALPKYDPKEEAPKWNFTRLWWGLPLDKQANEWTPIGTQPKTSSDPDWRGVIKENVIELPMPEPYKFGMYENPKYMWFDTPDYADPFKKLGWTLKYSIVSGFLYATGQGILQGLDPCTKNHFYLIKRYVVPWTMAATAGSAVVIAVANLRGKKDDKINYIVGGALAGAIIGRQTWYAATRCVIITAAIAAYAKWLNEMNGYFVPVFNWRQRNFGYAGANAENGFASGDLRFGLRTDYGDPGRDVRTFEA